MNGLSNLLLKAGPTRLFAALGVTAIVAGLLFALVFRIGGEEKSLLFANLDLKEAGQISQRLDQANIPYEARGDGSSIFVARSRVGEARLLVAADGLPSRGSVGYELFDQPDALGQTQFQQNINRLRALEGELARTIATLDGVASARVHLVLPERQLFSRYAEQPSASIVLQLKRDALSSQQVRAIRNLVASATPGLTTNRVTILDETGRLLAAATSGEDGDAAGDGVDARQAAAEERIRKTVTDIVEGVVGPGAARVMVTADLDPTSTTAEKIQYDPDGTGPIVRSTQTSDSKDVNNSPDNGGTTTASANIPNTGGQTSVSSSALSQSGTTTELTNNEISTLKTTTVTAPGDIRKIAVSVAVDDIEVPSKDGKSPPTYQKRPDADIQKIHDLVAAAVAAYVPAPPPGQPVEDPVKVINISFNHDLSANGGTAAKAPLFDFDKNDIMRAAEMGVLFLVALLTIFLVARPLLKFINGGGAGGAGFGGAQPALAGAGASGGSLPAGITAPSVNYQAADNIAAIGLVPSVEQEQRIDIARIEGQVKASSVKKVSEFVDRHPEESVSILRAWLHDS